MSLKWQSNCRRVTRADGIVPKTAHQFIHPHVETDARECAGLETLRAFAAGVNALARRHQTRPFQDMLAIADAFDLGVEAGQWGGDLCEFKTQLLRAAREGLVDLERCDVAGAMNKALLMRSRLQFGRDERHVIVSRADRRDCSGWLRGTRNSFHSIFLGYCSLLDRSHICS